MNETRKDILKHIGAVTAAVIVSLSLVWTGRVPKPEPAPDPTPEPIKVDLEIKGPSQPVEPGRLAKFTLPSDVSDVKGHWKVTARSTDVSDARIEEADGGTTCFVETFSPCTYHVSVAGLRDGKVFHWSTTFEVAGQKPIPPPKPENKPDVAVPSGSLNVAIVYESENETAEMGLTFVNLRTGSAAQWLSSKGHSLAIFDKDEVNADGETSKNVREWSGVYGGKTLPLLMAKDSTGKVVLSCQLPDSANGVEDALKKVGG